TSGAWRTYDETNSGLRSLPMRSEGWRVATQATFRISNTLSADAGYRADIGFGASGTDGDAALRWSPSDRWSLALRGTAFQTIGEFQVGEGRVYGGGGEAAWQISPTLRAVADGFLYRHSARERPELVDWN